MPPAVEIHSVVKSFAHHASRELLKTRLDRWFRRRHVERFYALRDVSLTVAPGECVALVGANGAGKSTLLSLVAGISFPDSGSIVTRGNVAALLELGAGFHPDLTGRENALLNASLLGLGRAETHAKYPSIEDFAELGEFVDEPLRTYSTGMIMRLAFAVAIHVDPEILIIDEAFAVGDQRFQTKCIDRILNLRAAGKTLLCVSHSRAILERLCSRALWLDHGRPVLEGNIQEVMDAYENGGREKPAATR
jgi:ABC-type polysaccharide/polyol phosphate transport system ATPase subunit